MKICQDLVSLAITLVLVSADEKKAKQTDKTDVKRQIGYGFEAIPGVAAVHAPLSDEASLLAIGRTTAHGGYGVHPVGIIHNAPVADSIGGFTSHGFDAYHGGYGVYAAPHTYIATPVVNVPKPVQFDQGWKGIDGGHGSIKHGHEIAQSLATKPAVPVHEPVYDVAPIAAVPQFNYGKGSHTGGYIHNSLIPSHSGFGTSGFSAGAKGYLPIPNVKTPVHAPGHGLIHGTAAPKGYSFATLHAAPAHGSGHAASGGHPSYHHNTQFQGHNSFGNNVHAPVNHNYVQSQNSHHHYSAPTTHKGHVSKVHGTISHGHQLAKNIHASSPHSGFGVNHGAHGKGYTSAKQYHNQQSSHGSHLNPYHGNVHSSGASHKYDAPTSSNNYLVPSGHGFTSPGASHALSNPARTASSVNSGENSPSHDASSRASSTYNTNSVEHSDAPIASSPHTNGHQKATSFQSFIIHSYKPHSGKHQEYQNDSQESDENYSSPNYNSGQAHSSETHF